MDKKAEYQLSNALALDKKYKKLFIENGAFNDEVEKYRNILRNSFEQIFLIDLNYAVSNDIESSLWRNIFYLVIDDYRKKNKEYKRVYSNLNQEGKFEFKVYSSLFHSFIKESISFYTDFIQKLTKLYNLTQVTKVFKPVELSLIDVDIEPIDPSKINEKTKEIAVKVCHQTLIYLGDLIRYAEMYSDVSYKNWSIAENYYQMAIQLIPYNGNPFNQLAVISSYELKSIIAIENYMRSLVIRVPFTTSSDNLYLAIEKVKSKKDILKEKFKNRQYPKSFSKAYITSLKSDFLNDYERLISYAYGNTKDVNNFLELKTYIIDIFPILLEAKILDSETLITLSTINMALHYLLVNKHLTKLCKIKKENIPEDFDEPGPMDEAIKEELIKFNMEFFTILLTVALCKENTITVNASTFSYANAVSLDDNKKKQMSTDDNKMNYPNLTDLLINIIIYTQWCKVKLNEGCRSILENTEWLVKLKEVLTALNDIAPIKTEALINNKKQDLFVTENGYYLFKNAVFLRGFIPLLEESNDKQKNYFNNFYYKSLEDVSTNPNDHLNDQIHYFIKLAYEISGLSEDHLLFSLKINSTTHKMKLIFTNSKEETLKMTGINVLTGRKSFESLYSLNEDHDNDEDEENLQETIVFTGRNKGNKTPPNLPKPEIKGKESGKIEPEPSNGTKEINNNEIAMDEPTINESTMKEPSTKKLTVNEPILNEPIVNEPKFNELTTNEPTTNEPTTSEPTVNESTMNEPTLNKPFMNEPTMNKKSSTEDILKPPFIIDDKDDLDISMDIKSIIGNTSGLPADQANNTNDNTFLNDKNTLNFMDALNNTQTAAFISNTTTPSGFFSPFDWTKEYLYPFTNSNSIIPTQNPINKTSTSTDLLNNKSDIVNDKFKMEKRNSTPLDLSYKWLQNQVMYPPPSSVNAYGNKSKSYDDSSLRLTNDNSINSNNNNNIDHPSIPPGLSVQTKNKVPPIFTNSAPSSANSDGFVTADIFNKMNQQRKSATPPSSHSVLSNPLKDHDDELLKVDVISPNSYSLLQQQQQQGQSSLKSVDPSQPLGLNVDASVGTNILGNPLFMQPKSQTTSNFPPFPSSQLVTPQKPTSTTQQSSQPNPSQHQQPNPSNIQSPLFFQNNPPSSSNVNSPAHQMFMSNAMPPSFQPILPLNPLQSSLDPSGKPSSGLNAIPNSVNLPNSYLSHPYSSQIYPPGFNPTLLQQQQQQTPPSQTQTPQSSNHPPSSGLPTNLPASNLPSNLSNANIPGANIPGANIPGGLPPNNIPGLPNMSMNMGMVGNLNMNNGIFGNNPLGNFPGVDPRLLGIPPSASNNTNLSALNGLLSNPSLSSLASSSNPTNTNRMPPLNLPMGMNTNPSSYPMSSNGPSGPGPNGPVGSIGPVGPSGSNGNVNPLLNLLNSPMSFNSVGAGLFYDNAGANSPPSNGNVPPNTNNN